MTYEEFKKRYQYNIQDVSIQLGSGGFGKVFKANDTNKDKWVAIKPKPSSDWALDLPISKHNISINLIFAPHIFTFVV